MGATPAHSCSKYKRLPPFCKMKAAQPYHTMSDQTRYLYTFEAASANAVERALILVPAGSSEEEMIGGVFASLNHKTVSTLYRLDAELCGVYKGVRRLEGEEELKALNADSSESKKSSSLLTSIGKRELTYCFGNEYHANIRWTAFRDGFAMCAKKDAELRARDTKKHIKGC